MISLQKSQSIRKPILLKATFISLVILLIINTKWFKQISFFSFITYIVILLFLSFTSYLIYFSSIDSTQTQSIANDNNKELNLKIYTNVPNTPQSEYDSLILLNQIYHKFLINNPVFSCKHLENGNNVVFDLNDKLPSLLTSNKIQANIPGLKSIIRNYLTLIIEEDEQNFVSINNRLSLFNIQLTKLLSNDYYKKSYIFDECIKGNEYYTVFYGDNKRLNLLINILEKQNQFTYSSDDISSFDYLINLLQYRIYLNERVMSDMFISVINDLHRNLVVLYSFKRLREIIIDDDFNKGFYNNKGNTLYGREWNDAFPTDTQLVTAIIVNSIRNKTKSKRLMLLFPETPDYTTESLFLYQKNPKEKEPYFCVFYDNTFIPSAFEDNLFYSLQLYLEIGIEIQYFQSEESTVNNLLKKLLKIQCKI